MLDTERIHKSASPVRSYTGRLGTQSLLLLTHRVMVLYILGIAFQRDLPAPVTPTRFRCRLDDLHHRTAGGASTRHFPHISTLPRIVRDSGPRRGRLADLVVVLAQFVVVSVGWVPEVVRRDGMGRVFGDEGLGAGDGEGVGAVVHHGRVVVAAGVVGVSGCGADFGELVAVFAAAFALDWIAARVSGRHDIAVVACRLLDC